MGLGGWSISEDIITALRLLVPEGSPILEFGSGEGTKELAKYYDVTSIEDNEKYIGLYDSRYIHATIVDIKPHAKFVEAERWYDFKVIEKELKDFEYKAILIDGPKAPYRTGLWKYKDFFNWDVPVIFDDTHRQLEWKLARHLGKLNKRTHLLTLNVDKEKAFTVMSPYVGDLRKLI